MNSVASIKDRLKNKSRETGRTLQELFTLYGLERTIHRLSISRYRENFVLKGGIFLYALYREIIPEAPRILICWRKGSAMLKRI